MPAPARTAQTLDLTVTSLGGLGDGLSTHEGVNAYVPFGLPGEKLRCHITRRNRHGIWADIDAVLEPSADRVAAPCRHFGSPGDACGGCSLQHMSPPAYAAFKQQLVEKSAARFPGVHILPLEQTGPHGRRRASFKVRAGKLGVEIGFYAGDSHHLVALKECPVLEPAIENALPMFAQALSRLSVTPQELSVALLDSGLDVMIRADVSPSLADNAELSQMAEKLDLARLSWDDGYGASPLLSRRPARVRFGEVDVEAPPGSFLQASGRGQKAITAHVRAFANEAKYVTDLFSGCGTYSFPLSSIANVTAYEGDGAMVEAATRAANAHGLSGKVEFYKRNLAHSPVLRHELKRCDTVIINPPRGGASEQMMALSASMVKRIVMVSCNPASFVRDAKLLTEGGYALRVLVGIDQFHWSSHLELVALFMKES
ncbi:MAG: class I SAM-dependent RNA methyltransferase [Alphaproteobacteria bacterium]|nr:class I SAM-dependent RNA methyltransferase [Alphaproteobacteria bacterium]